MDDGRCGTVAKRIISEFVTLRDGSVVKNHERHDFDKPTKLLLQHMAGGVCSNPDCCEYTIGANIERNSYSGNGIAAHICAAAPGPGAARYDKNQSKDERKSYNNGIWLCGSCSIIIDSDEARYPVSRLHEWKKKAEVRSMSMIGQKSITPFELQDSIMQAIIKTTRSLSGALNPEEPRIVETVASYEAYMNSLDKRFNVKITSDSKFMSHEISAIPGHNPEISLVFSESTFDTAQTGWQSMVENGQSFSIPTEDFEFKGSDLFESLNEKRDGGVLIISPKPKPIHATIYFVNEDREYELAAIDAFMTTGSKMMRVKGEAFNGIFSFTYEYIVESGITNFIYSFDVSYWLRQKLTDLKHFNKLVKAYRFVSKHKDLKICVRLDVNNQEISLGMGPSSAYESMFERIESIMYMTECSARIAAKFSKVIRLKTLDLTAVENEVIVSFSKLLDGDIIDNFEPNPIICTAVLNDVPPEIMSSMENHTLTTNLRFSKSNSFSFFGNDVTLPTTIIDVNHFELNLFSSIHPKSKGQLFCIIYSVKNTEAVQYLASDEPYILH